MLSRESIEKILVDNGVAPTAPDEDIKSALIRANWKNEDVQTALIVLRENKKTHETHVDAVQNLFRGNAKLDPKDINALLGIEVDLTPKDIYIKQKRARGKASFGQVLEICFMSFVLSLIFIISAMWFFKVGMFHQTLM